MRTSARLLACLLLAAFGLPRAVQAQSAGGTAYLDTWTETEGTPSKADALAQPFRDREGRLYAAEAWTPAGSSTSLTRLHRWDGRRWSHLDVRHGVEGGTRYAVEATDLVLVEGDTLVAATSAGPLKYVGAGWRRLYASHPGASGPVKRLAYDAANRRLYMGGTSDFTVGSWSSASAQRSVGYLDLATRRWKGIGGYGTGVDVRDLAVEATGGLVVVGTFTAIGGKGASYMVPHYPYVPATPVRWVARYTVPDSTWTDLGQGLHPSVTLQPYVNAGGATTMRLGPDGSVFVTTYVQTLAGREPQSVWQRDASGVWTALDGPAAPLPKPADGLHVLPDGTVWATTPHWTTHSARGSTWRRTAGGWEEIGGVLANFYAFSAQGAYSGRYDLKPTRVYAWHALPDRTCVYAVFEFAIASGPNNRKEGLACRASETERWRLQVPAGAPATPITAIGRTENGTLYAAGRFTQIGTLDAAGFAVRVGDAWVPAARGPFAPATGVVHADNLGDVYSLVSDGAGGLLVGGGGPLTNTAGQGAVLRFTPGTTPDHGTWARVKDLTSGSIHWRSAVHAVVPGHGGYYVAGSFAGGLYFWKGTTWKSFGLDQRLDVAPLPGPDGTLYVGGGFHWLSASGSQSLVVRGVAKYVPQNPADPAAAGQWSALAGGLSGLDYTVANSTTLLRSLAFGPGGQVCAGGTFAHTPGKYDGGPAGAEVRNLVCFNGTQWLAPATPFPGSATSPAPAGSSEAQEAEGVLAAMPEVTALAGDGVALYVGGNGLLARYKDGAWTHLGGATPPTVSSLALGPHGMDVLTPSGTLLALSQSQLPVELVAFSALATRPGTLSLAWTTASETNNAGFYVEYQPAAATGWSDGGFVPGHGTTTERHAYAHDLASLALGRYRLRLRQLDTDGTVHVSPVVEAAVSAGETLAVSAGPTPARSHAWVRLYAPTEDDVRVTVYDLLGREVARLHDGPLAAGAHALALPVAAWAAGTYLVRVDAAGQTNTRRLVVAR